MTFCCRPGNPLGDLPALPAARPLVVDEAYFEYAGETAVPLLDDGVIVIRTFSKAFGLAGARIGYLLAQRDAAADLRARQAPAPVSTLSVALALAALRTPPDVADVVEERDRLTAELRTLGFEPLPSRANFVFVPTPDAVEIGARLLVRGCVVRLARGGIRITVRDREDDDLLLGVLVVDGSGDLETGPHHTAEDTAIALGEAIDRALGDRRGIARYGSAVVPMDDALARAAVDLGGRRGAEINLAADPGLARHALESLAHSARMTLHVSATGRDPHHVAEAACKAVGRALRDAVRRDGGELPSTKGLL